MKPKNYIICFFIIGAIGTVGHFLYDLSGKNTFVGYFAPVNESVWEHLKLLFFPTIIFSAFEYFLLKEKPNNYLPMIAISLFIGLVSIFTIFYTYSGVLGFKIEWFNIAIYYISLVIMIILKAFISMLDFNCKIANYVSLFWIFIMALAFILFTYNPPSFGIFEDA